MDGRIRRVMTAVTAGWVWGLGALTAAAGQAPLAAGEAASRLVRQIDIAMQHASFAWQASDARGLQLHSHHVVNIVAGSKSSHFQASFGNPGDGYGALEYARDLRASPEVSAAGWADGARLVASWLEQALEHAVRAAAVADQANAAEAKAQLALAVAFLSAAKGRPGEKAPVAGAVALQEALQARPAAPSTGNSSGGYY